MTRKELFRYFIYGYLNEKMVGRWQTGGHLNRKPFKKKAIASYLNIGRYPSWMGNALIDIAGLLELPLSLFMETFLFFKYVIGAICCSRKQEEGQIYFIGTKEQRIKQELRNARISDSEVVVIKFLGWDYGQIFEGLKQTSILSGIRLADICRAYRYSMRLSIFMQRKYGNNDMFFRSYSSFEFFLAAFYLSRLDLSKKVVYVETYSRWAFLCGSLNHHVIFVQHGIIGKELNFLIKIGSPNDAYFLNKKEEQYCCEYMFKKKPAVYYLEGLKFTSNEKLLLNGKKNVLIVCHYIYFDIEKRLALALNDLNAFNIYMKPHPLDPRENYEELGDQIGAVILEKPDYPKVDEVIAYNSTLAVEYAEAGIPVIRHDEIPFEDIICKLKQIE